MPEYLWIFTGLVFSGEIFFIWQINRLLNKTIDAQAKIIEGLIERLIEEGKNLP